MTEYPEKIVQEDVVVPNYILSLIKAYEDHIETLKQRIRQLESNRTIPVMDPIGPPIHMEVPKPKIRTTSELTRRLEERSTLRDKEVKEEDVK